MILISGPFSFFIAELERLSLRRVQEHLQVQLGPETPHETYSQLRGDNDKQIRRQ